MPYRPAPSVHKLTSKTDYCPRWVAECMRAGRDRVRTTLFGELPRSEMHTKSWLCISSYSKALLRKLDNRASARVDSEVRSAHGSRQRARDVGQIARAVFERRN